MKNEKASKRRRIITLFDIIIIIIVLAVAFCVYRFTSSDGASGQSGTVVYTVELTDMRHGSAQLIAPGDSLKDNIKKYAIGTVVSVELSDAVISYRDNMTGEYAESTLEGAKTALVVIEAPCTETDSSITVGGGYSVRCGETAAVSGPGYAGAGYIVAVERGE